MVTDSSEFDELQIECLLDIGHDLNRDEKRQLVDELTKEVDGAEFGGEVKRKSPSFDPVSLGMLTFSSINAFIHIFRLINKWDKAQVGYLEADNQQIFATDDVDQTVIVNNGGTVITEVDGHVIHTANQEVVQAMREAENENGEEKDESE